MMNARESFLTDVGASLPLPQEVRAEVLAELETHLNDATDDLVARGTAPDEAESEAIARLGPPADLARALARAHRPRALVFAAAGGGAWAAVRDGVLGTIVGWAFVFFALTAGALLAEFVGHLLSKDNLFQFSPGWNTVLLALALHIGAVFSGAAAIRSVARGGWRLAAEVRPPVMLAGALVWGWFAIGFVSEPQNWPSTLTLALVPASFVVGTWFDRLHPPRPRVVIAMLLVAALVVLGLGITVGGGNGGGGAQSYQWDLTTHDYEMIGPWWQVPGSMEQPLDFASADYSFGEGTASVTVEASRSAMTRFSSFRLEAWQASPPGDGWHLLSNVRGPMATAPVEVDGTTLSGTIDFTHTPGADWAEVVMTGISPGGERYLLAAGGMPAQTTFQGSVLDWFVALTTG